MKTPNVVDTGHLAEQPTQIRNFRPELTLFHGYSFVRTNAGTIEAWLPGNCSCCSKSIYLAGQFIRVGALSDEEIQRHGLKKFEGERPLRGVKPYSGAELYCEICLAKWLKGEGLESLGHTRYVRNLWQN